MATVYASVVEENVDMAVSKRCLDESPFERFRVPYVGNDRLPRRSNFVGNSGRAYLLGVDNHNPCACCEGKSDPSTDATASTVAIAIWFFQQKIRKRREHGFV
jgi:hypothetical protein